VAQGAPVADPVQAAAQAAALAAQAAQEAARAAADAARDAMLAAQPPSKDGSGLCQGRATSMWDEPAARCVWGETATWPRRERERLIDAIVKSLPPSNAPMTASRIRRRAHYVTRDMRKLTRANVAALLILMMRSGEAMLIAQHNPSRKRRINYLWSRVS
jgi:hypothetical protein